MSSRADGERRYRLVQQYAAIGHHRTGTAEDDLTRQWLGDQLLACGVEPTEIGYEFPQFVADDHVVTINGDEVESVPLWYAGDGDHDTSGVLRRVVSFDGGGIGTARLSLGDEPNRVPAVVATDVIGGRLAVPNRAPSTSIDRPVALVPGRVGPLLQDASVRYRARLRRDRGRSANVLASFGDAGGSPVVVTTPITGWFACAGERATGIAIAIDLARELAEDHPVLFVATTGHEIGYLGVESLVDAGALGRPRAIIHVGASAAAGAHDGTAIEFTADRSALTTMAGDGFARLGEAVADGGYRTSRDPVSWLGEGEVLKRLESPMLSFLGSFPLFHTSDDLPHEATSPALLARAHQAIVQGARVLLDSLDVVSATELVR